MKMASQMCSSTLWISPWLPLGGCSSTFRLRVRSSGPLPFPEDIGHHLCGFPWLRRQSSPCSSSTEMVGNVLYKYKIRMVDVHTWELLEGSNPKGFLRLIALRMWALTSIRLHERRIRILGTIHTSARMCLRTLQPIFIRALSLFVSQPPLTPPPPPQRTVLLGPLSSPINTRQPSPLVLFRGR